MRILKSISNTLLAGALLVTVFVEPCSGQFVDYFFDGVITGVFENENDVVPGLAIGDSFSGQMRFDSQGWQNTAGIISVSINGVELLFGGDSIFGGLSNDPNYSFRILADQAGFGADIRNSTFSAGKFGIVLEAQNPSEQENLILPVPGPIEYETNSFSIFGTVIASDDRVSAIGEVTSLGQVAIDCLFSNDGDDDIDVDDINGFATMLGESALFYRCFDLNGDGAITLEDHDALIENLVEIAGGQQGTFIGDLNLDGVVDVLNDGFTLIGNLGQPGPFGYQDGDLNADRQVDVLGDGIRFISNLVQ